MFDSGGCSDHLRACPFLGGQRALLDRGVVWNAAMLPKAGAFSLSGGLQHPFRKGQGIWYAVRYCGKSLYPRS